MVTLTERGLKFVDESMTVFEAIGKGMLRGLSQLEQLKAFAHHFQSGSNGLDGKEPF